MKLMTIWRAYNKAIFRRTLGISHPKLFRQEARFASAIEQHLQEWDDDIEELERLLDEI